MNFDSEYRKKQLKVIQDIDNLYNNIVDELLPYLAAARLEDKYFQFKDYRLTKEADKIIKRASATLNLYIGYQCKSVWTLANLKNDTIVDKVLKDAPKRFKQTNLEVLDKFLNRKVENLTISDRVWNLNGNHKKELESAISAAIEKGQSAESLARDIKKYLNNPDARYRRVRDKYGRLAPSKNALSYHPGQGVYRSAKQNALRLARNEINNAYRLSEWERWQQIDFIIGFRIQNSNRVATVCKICKEHNGKYFPKTVKFLGFHISCLCTCVVVFGSEI